MSVTSQRTVQINFDGDIYLQQPFSAVENVAASGQSDIITLNAGVNVIIPPTVSGVANKGVTIIPPAGNSTLITLKGVGGDTGVPLHKTDPTSLGLDSTFASFTLSVPLTLAGVRLIWS